MNYAFFSFLNGFLGFFNGFLAGLAENRVFLPDSGERGGRTVERTKIALRNHDFHWVLIMTGKLRVCWKSRSVSGVFLLDVRVGWEALNRSEG